MPILHLFSVTKFSLWLQLDTGSNALELGKNQGRKGAQPLESISRISILQVITTAIEEQSVCGLKIMVAKSGRYQQLPVSRHFLICVNIN
jgi:hypothetical protein